MGSSRGHVLVEHTSDPRQSVPGEIRAFAKCRNERLRLPAFLTHYRALGVDRFFIVDNDSSDGTTEYLAGQPDVCGFRTTNRLSESGAGSLWLNPLLSRFGVGAWCVTVDIDELLVYPGSEQASLRDLTAHFDRTGCEALSCLLLDLYPPGPLAASRYSPGDDLLAAAPYFDAGPYEKSPVETCPGVFITGGMRERVFYPKFRARGAGAKACDALLNAVAYHFPILGDTPWVRARWRRRPPLLTKVPLVRWDAKSMYINSSHWVSPKNRGAGNGSPFAFQVPPRLSSTGCSGGSTGSVLRRCNRVSAICRTAQPESRHDTHGCTVDTFRGNVSAGRPWPDGRYRYVGPRARQNDPMTTSTRCHVLVERTTNRQSSAPGGIRAFSVCRNERLRLPAFLNHYRSLGVDEFLVIDNDSSDGSMTVPGCSGRMFELFLNVGSFPRGETTAPIG